MQKRLKQGRALRWLSRRTPAVLAAAAVLAGAVAPLGVVAPARAETTAPLAAPNAATTCLPTGGVGTVDPGNPSKPLPADQNASVYVGGNFARAAGAELEGQLVVRGDARFSSSTKYSLGWVGAGSGLIPAAGGTALRVGGNLTIDRNVEVLAGTADSQTKAPLPVHARIGGAVTGAGTLAMQHSESTIQQGLGTEIALGSPAFSQWANNNHQPLRDLSERNQRAGTPGTVSTEAGGYLTLTGAPGATRHLFEIDASLLGKNAWSLNLGANIQPTHPIVIVVKGPQPTVNIQSVWANKQQINMGDARFGQLASQIMWTFPNATNVTIAGAQVPGSVVVPTNGSATTVTAAGANGRYWVAGNLTQNGAGAEFHNFPFIGDETTDCRNPVDPDPEPEPLGVCEANTFYALDQVAAYGNAVKFHRYEVNGRSQISKNADVLSVTDGTLSGWNTNALGMTRSGDFLFTAQQRDTSNRLTANTKVMRASRDLAGKVRLTQVGTPFKLDHASTIVAGAVDPATEDFYFGYYVLDNDGRGNRWNELHVYRSVRGTEQPSKLLTAIVPDAKAVQGANGDFAFDSLGNLHFVASANGSGSGWNATPGSALTGLVSKTQIASALAAGRPPQVTANVNVTKVQNPLSGSGFNGMAFTGSGKLVAEQGQSQVVADPGTFTKLGDGYNNSGTALVDLASCATPPTLTVLKNVNDRVEDADQFRLELAQENTLLSDATTSGSVPGIQEAQIGPLPVSVGSKYQVREAFPVASNAEMYASSLACVRDPEGRNDPVAATATSGKKHSWELIIPAGSDGANIVCTVTNDALHPNLVVSKSSDPKSGTAVKVGDTVKYTLSFANTGKGPAKVNHVDHLADVLDDATLTGTITAQSGLTAEFSKSTQQIAVTGTVPVGKTLTVTYSVRVKEKAAPVADASADGPREFLLRNYVTKAGKTPPSECVPKPGEPVTCTEHPVPGWDIQKSAQPPHKASLHTGGNVYYTVTLRNFSGAALTGITLEDDITEVMRVATWDPAAPRVVPKVQGVRFLNAAGQQVDQNGAVMSVTGRPGSEAPDSLPYTVVTPPVHSASGSRAGGDDPRRGTWTLDTRAFDVPKGVVRIEVSYAVKVGAPADPADPTQAWQRDGAPVVAEPLAVFDNFVSGTSKTVPPLTCATGTDVTKDPKCQTGHQLGDGYFHIQKNSTAPDPKKPGSVEWNLQGVEFEIRDTPDGGPSKALCDASQDPSCAEFFAHTDDADGQAAGSWHASNLPEGDYYLVETKAAAGHQLLAEPIRFRVGPANPEAPLGRGQLGIYKPGIAPDRSFNGTSDRPSDFFLERCDAPTQLPQAGGPACVMPTGWLMQVYDPKLLPLPMSGGVPPYTLYAGGAIIALGIGLWLRRTLRQRRTAAHAL